MKIARLYLRSYPILYLTYEGGFTEEDLQALDTALRPLYAGIMRGLMTLPKADHRIVVRLYGGAEEEVVSNKVVSLGYNIDEREVRHPGVIISRRSLRW